jgi:hypothetical protein
MCILRLIGFSTSKSDLYIYWCIACQWRTGRIFPFAKLSCWNLGPTLRSSLTSHPNRLHNILTGSLGGLMSFLCLFKKILHLLNCRYVTPSSFKDYHNEPNHSGLALCWLVVASLRLAFTQGLILHLQSRGLEAVPIASPLLCSEWCDPAPISACA